MKRRDLFKMLATLAAVPFVAPLVAMCKPKNEGFTEVQRVTGMRVISSGNSVDWSDNPISRTAGHVCMPGMDVLAYDPSKFKLRPPPVGFEQSLVELCRDTTKASKWWLESAKSELSCKHILKEMGLEEQS